MVLTGIWTLFLVANAQAATNQAPSVSAGPDQIVTLPSAATLAGLATDDGLPAPSNLRVAWSKVSGPGTVTFSNKYVLSPSVTFGIAGDYVLRLTASDGSLRSSDSLFVTVLDAAPMLSVSVSGNPATPPYAVTAVTNATTDVRVEFLVDGSAYHTENLPPYSIFGDDGTTPTKGSLGAGTHVVTARLFAQNGTSVLTSAAVTVAEGGATPSPTPTPTPMPTATPTATPVPTPSPTPIVVATATPMPTPSPTPIVLSTPTPTPTPVSSIGGITAFTMNTTVGNAGGLGSLTYNGQEFLNFGGNNWATGVFFTDGQPAPMSVRNVFFDTSSVTRIYDWGKTKLSYAASGNQLAITIAVTNTTSTRTISSLQIVPLEIKFPASIPAGTTPRMSQNQMGPTVQVLDCGSAAVAIVNEDLVKLLHVGFPWSDNEPTRTIFPVHVGTGRSGMYSDSWPNITDRQIGPGQTDTYKISVRFGPSGSTARTIAPDIFARYPLEIPFALAKWTDRRPIGEIFLAAGTWGGTGSFTRNPRGWFNDSSLQIVNSDGSLNMVGVAEFQKRLLTFADTSVSVMRNMNSQGMIVYDVEGEFFPQMTTYIGDPAITGTLAPEMMTVPAGTSTPVVDQFFKKFTDAGFRTGVLIRPHHLVSTTDYKTVAGTMQVEFQRNETRANWANKLVEKIQYTKNRWGCTLFYCDSNSPSFADGDIFREVMRQVPDVLITPEYAMRGLLYYGTVAPMYIPGFAGGGGHTALELGVHIYEPTMRDIYPDCFAVIRTGNIPSTAWPTLTESVRRGDILTFPAWWNAPDNAKVKAAYTGAGF